VIGERFDGANWQLESIPVTSPLADVSCPSRLFCMAVGRADNGVQGTTEAAKWTP
jgi:hypothetical protein